MSGFFVTFEGGEGAGKSTLLNYLSQKLSSEGANVIVTREPGGTPLGNTIRDLLLQKHDFSIGSRAELFLFLAARAQHVEECILPSLKQGALILCDRFSDSTIAYQGAGRRLGLRDIENLCDFATMHVTPGLTFYLDIDPEKGKERIVRRDTLDRMEEEQLDFHTVVRAAFLDIAKRYPERIVVLDGLLSRQELFQIAYTELKSRWPVV